MAFLTKLLTDQAELLALAVFLIDLGIKRWGVERVPITRIVIRILLFIVFTYLLFRAKQVPYIVSPPREGALARLIDDGLKGVWWIWAAALGADTLRTFAFRGSTLSGHKLIQDLCVAGIYLWAFVGLIVYVLNLPIQGVLVTSGAVAVVLGLALQSSLGDVFYGIVLTLEKPCGPGDWISIENGVSGRVLEMNWRSTRLLSDSQDVIIVPNTVIAKSRIINASYPTRIHGTTISVPLASSVSPAVGVTALYNAAFGCSNVLATPAPAAHVKTTSLEATVVEITFFTADVALSATARNQVYEKIYRSLGALGIGLGSTTGSTGEVRSSGMSEIERLVAFTPVFRLLPPEDRATIADSMTRHAYEAGTVVLESGAAGDALYVVGSGVLSVTREIGGQALETERLTASDHFGGVELLQGGNRLSRVSALTGAVVYCLHSDALLKLAERRPAFKEDMRQGLAAMRAMEAKLVEQWDIARSPPGMHENWLLRLKHLHVPFVESEEQDG